MTTGTRVLAAAATALTLIGLTTACNGSSHGHGSPASARAADGTTPPTAKALAAPGTAAAAFCADPLPAAWQHALTAGRYTTQGQLDLAVSADGSWRAVRSGTGAGAELVAYHGGSAHPVGRIPAGGVVWAQFQADRLVYAVSPGPDDEGSYSLYSWDTAAPGAAPKLLAAPPQGNTPATGAGLPSVGGGYVTWAQPLKNGQNALHLYQLSTGRDRVVDTGHDQSPTVVGSLLVWLQSAQSAGTTSVKAAALATGAPAALPAPVAALRGTDAVVGEGGTWLWVAADRKTVRAWHSGWAAPVTVVGAGVGDGVQDLAVNDGYAVFTEENADVRVADLSAHTTAVLARGDGYADASGPWLLVSAAGKHYRLTTATLPHLSGCTHWQP